VESIRTVGVEWFGCTQLWQLEGYRIEKSMRFITILILLLSLSLWAAPGFAQPPEQRSELHAIKGTWCRNSGESMLSAPREGKLALCRKGRCYLHKFEAQSDNNFTLEYQGKMGFFKIIDMNTLEREKVIWLSNGSFIDGGHAIFRRCEIARIAGNQKQSTKKRL